MNQIQLLHLSACSWCGESFFRKGEDETLCGPCREAARKQIARDARRLSQPRVSWSARLAVWLLFATLVAFAVMVVALAVMLVRTAAGV